MYSIVPRNFPVWYFFEGCSEWIDVYFHHKSFSRISNAFSTLLIHSALRLCFLRSHILLPDCFVSLSWGCSYEFFYSPLQLVEYSFVVFEYRFLSVLFCCIIFFFTSIAFFLFVLCSSVVLLSYPFWLLSEIYNVRFQSNQVLSFYSYPLRGYRFFYRLISLWHRLVCLNPLCCSYRYVQIVCLFFQFLPWEFSQSLGFLYDGNQVFFFLT